jgi:hypothetical protein
MSKKGVVVSDLHAGSIYGILPPDFVTYEGVPCTPNIGQEYLWDCFTDFCQRVGVFKPDFVIINGDMIDGKQHRNDGAELKLPDWRDQRLAAQAALLYLQGYAPGAKWYFTQGTPYHVGNFGDAEENIAEALGAEKYHSVGTGRLCREVLWLEVEGVILEAAHHIAVAAGFYRLTPLDREAQWSAISAKDASKGVPKSDLLIRSHVHTYSYGEHASKQIVTTPCWQLQTRYMRKQSVHRMHPDIGGIFITVDGEAKARGNAPCLIQKELYKLPAVPITSL